MGRVKIKVKRRGYCESIDEIGMNGVCALRLAYLSYSYKKTFTGLGKSQLLFNVYQKRQ